MPRPKAKGVHGGSIKRSKSTRIPNSKRFCLPCGRGPVPFNISETLRYTIAVTTVVRQYTGEFGVAFAVNQEIAAEMIIGSVTNSR